MKHEGHLQDYGDGVRSLCYLVTGPRRNRNQFITEVWPDVLDSRKATTRLRLFILPEEAPEQAEARLIEAAQLADVTLQRLMVVGPPKETETTELKFRGGASVRVGPMQEEYPIVHLGTHGKRWG